MKNILFGICLCSILTIGACKGISGSNAADPGGGSSGGGSVGGGSETPAKSKLDTIIDTVKMPGHVAVDSVKKN